jgi:hypothetical protein
MRDTERAWLAALDPMPAHFDLQPAIAARRAASAGSLVWLVQLTKPVMDTGPMFAE